MHFRPLTIRQKGLRNHLKEWGVDYDKFTKLMEYGATNIKAGKKLGIDPHTISKWRKIYEHEQAVDSLNGD